MYEVGTSTAVTAWHVMPGMPGPEGQPHTHDYRIEVVVRRDDLGDRGMVCDLDVLQEALESAVGSIRDQDLEMIRPSAVEAVTVEVFARWVHDQLRTTIQDAGGGVLDVRVWESPDTFGGYGAVVP